MASYRTRAQTGSLRPKRYLSSEEEEDARGKKRRSAGRAQSFSSRDSSVNLPEGPDEEDDNSDDDESSGKKM